MKIYKIEKDIAQKDTNTQKKFKENWKAFEKIDF